ncbi:MAG: isopentenyl phosphate kinase [Candidatus Norongarragalinales archaeon]
MEKHELVFLKLGGSLVTDKTKPFTTRPTVIHRLCREIAEARKAKKFNLLVGNGGGSFPHGPAQRFQTQKGYLSPQSVRGFAEVQDAAARLNRIIVNALIAAGVNACSIQPSAGAIAKNSRIIKWDLAPLKKILALGLVPCVYGDVAIDERRGMTILSTEEIFAFLARELKPSRIIVAGEVDGVLTKDPNKEPSASLILEINKKNYLEVASWLGGSRAAADVTGGMLGKVNTLRKIAALSRKTEIIVVNGLVAGRVRDALEGKKVVGTKIKN